jgi:hypothetical protein
VDRFGGKAYIGAPAGTGDEAWAHVPQGRRLGYDEVVKPRLESHRDNPHFRVFDRHQL